MRREGAERSAEALAEMSRAEIIEVFRDLVRQSKKPLGATDLPSPLWFALRRHFGSIDNARRAAGVSGPERPRRWSKEKVVAEIREVHRTGGRITDLELTATGRHDLLGAIREYFKSIVRARRAAGVPEPEVLRPERQQWDEQRITQEILSLHRDGESIAASKVPNVLLKAGKRYFGSWKAAIEAAGFDYDEIRLQREPYTDGELVEALRSLAAQHPEMTASELGDQLFFPAIKRVFGSTEEACRRAGLEGWPQRERQRALSRDDVLIGIRRREDHREPINWDAVNRDDYTLWYSAILHYGEWSRALEAAGVDTSSLERSWTAETLLEAIRERSRKGLSLKPEDMVREDSRLYFSARTYFGGWLNAVRKVADTPWALTYWTPELVIQALQKAARGRKRLTARQAGQKLTVAAQTQFGSWSAACRAAGLEAVVGLGGPPRRPSRGRPRR